MVKPLGFKGFHAMTKMQLRVLVISYLRFSHPDQQFGDSERRQLDKAKAWCLERGLTLDETLADLGLSGYHGRHRSHGALGRFIEKVDAGKIPRGTILIIEDLDRLSRELTSEAQELFLHLVNQGVEIVDLANDRHFTKKSVNDNPGELFLTLGQMMGNHHASKTKADRIRETWKKRRTDSTNMCPAWIDRTDKGFKINPAKAAIVRRIFRLVLTMGVWQIVRKLNKEKVPTLWKEGQFQWHAQGVRALIRNRRVLGEQAIGTYEAKKRSETGAVTLGAYPAILKEHEWLAANDAMDARKRGVSPVRGRNSTNVTNLFGNLATCGVCKDGRMIVAQRARKGDYFYFGCSNAKRGECDHTGYFRLDHVESAFSIMFAAMLIEPDDSDPNADLRSELAEIEAEVERLARLHDKKYRDGDGEQPEGSLERRSFENLKVEHRAMMLRASKITQRLAATELALPRADGLREAQALWQGLANVPREQRAEVRAKIASTLPLWVKKITFDDTGIFSVALKDWVSIPDVPLESGMAFVRPHPLIGRPAFAVRTRSER